MRPYPGILSVNPNPDLLPKSQDSFTRALGISGDIYNMIGKNYENKLREAQARNFDLEAQKRAGTLQSDINAGNIKNQTDIQYYPQIQAAKLAQEGATIKEIQAKTGLTYAQTKHALAMTANTQREGAIGGAQGKLFQAYEAAPVGSPQKAYFGALLNKEMGGFAPVEGGMAAGGQVPSTPKGGNVPSGMPNGLQLNPLGGGPRTPFHQAFDPLTGKTIESPTTASATRNQTRTEAHQEIENLYPKVIEGLKPYQGPMGSLSLINDSRKASSGDKGAQKRLEAFELSKRFLPELASINARQATGSNPGIELTREYQNAMFPALPGGIANYFVPSDVRAQANLEYAPTQAQAVETALNEERQGYKRHGEIPSWSGQQQQMTRGGFGAGGYVPPQTRVASGFNGNPNVEQEQKESAPNYQAMADQAIAAGADPEKVRQRLAQMMGGR